MAIYLEHKINLRIFAKKRDAMLGIDTKELPKVEGKYAKEMREALYRSHKGELNASEKKVLNHSFFILAKYESEWR